MSKFINAVEAKLTDERFLLPAEFWPLSVETDIADDIQGGYVYKIGVEWKAEALVKKASDAESFRQNVIMDLTETVYGDLRRLILRAQLAAHNRDYDETLKCLQAVLDEAYGKGR